MQNLKVSLVFIDICGKYGRKSNLGPLKVETFVLLLLIKMLAHLKISLFKKILKIVKTIQIILKKKINFIANHRTNEV